MPKAVPRLIKSFGGRTSHLDSAEEVRNRGALYLFTSFQFFIMNFKIFAFSYGVVHKRGARENPIATPFLAASLART